jgi:hypothetical protein
VTHLWPRCFHVNCISLRKLDEVCTRSPTLKSSTRYPFSDIPLICQRSSLPKLQHSRSTRTKKRAIGGHRLYLNLCVLVNHVTCISQRLSDAWILEEEALTWIGRWVLTRVTAFPFWTDHGTCQLVWSWSTRSSEIRESNGLMRRLVATWWPLRLERWFKFQLLR